MTMPFTCEHRLLIEAPPSIVWEVITDLDAYPEWNPFQVAVRSSLIPGDPIDMRVQLVKSFVQSQREKIFECVAGEKLAYGLEGDALGAIRSRRAQTLVAASEQTTDYSSDFRLEGWAVPLTAALLGRALARGFDEASRALKVRAELLREERS